MLIYISRRCCFVLSLPTSTPNTPDTASTASTAKAQQAQQAQQACQETWMWRSNGSWKILCLRLWAIFRHGSRRTPITVTTKQQKHETKQFLQDRMHFGLRLIGVHFTNWGNTNKQFFFALFLFTPTPNIGFVFCCFFSLQLQTCLFMLGSVREDPLRLAPASGQG